MSLPNREFREKHRFKPTNEERNFLGVLLGGLGGALLGGSAAVSTALGVSAGVGALAGGFLGGGIGSSMDSARAQANALERAGDITGAAELRRQAIEAEKLEIAKGLLAEGEPLREALIQSGLETLPGLTSFADISKAGTGPGFTIPLKHGLRELSAGLAPFGSTLGTSPQLTAGLTERLLSSDINRRLGAGQSLLGLAPTGTSGGIGLLSQTGGTGLAGVQTQIAAQQGQANPYGDIAGLGGFLGGGLLQQGLYGGGSNTRRPNPNYVPGL